MRTVPTLVLLGASALSVSCLGDFNLFTVDEDVQLGQELKAEIEANPQDYPVLDRSRYPEAYDHLDRITREILNSGDIVYRDDFAWEFFIIEDDDTLNAFAAPGGYIWVYSGIIKYLDREDDLAGVLAHEIAHSDNRHSTQQLTKAYGLGTLLEVILGENQGILTDIAASLVSLEFSREDETEADEFSVYYLCESIYAADGAASFFEKIGSSGVPEILSTHPDPENRVQDIRALAVELGCDTTPSDNDLEWADFQASLP